MPFSQGRGRGTLILSYIRRLGSLFSVQNFEISLLFVFSRNEYFIWYEDFVDIVLRSSQNWTIFRGHFYALLGLRYRMEGYFFGLVKFQILFGVLEIPDIFFG